MKKNALIKAVLPHPQPEIWALQWDVNEHNRISDIAKTLEGATRKEWNELMAVAGLVEQAIINGVARLNTPPRVGLIYVVTGSNAEYEYSVKRIFVRQHPTGQTELVCEMEWHTFRQWAE